MVKNYTVFAFRKSDNAGLTFSLKSDGSKDAWTAARDICRRGGTVETPDGATELTPGVYGVSRVATVKPPRTRRVSAEQLIDAADGVLEAEQVEQLRDLMAELAAAD